MHGDLWYAQNAARMSEISRILHFQLFILQNDKSFETQNKNAKKSLRKLLRVFLIRFHSKSVLISKI